MGLLILGSGRGITFWLVWSVWWEDCWRFEVLKQQLHLNFSREESGLPASVPWVTALWTSGPGSGVLTSTAWTQSQADISIFGLNWTVKWKKICSFININCHFWDTSKPQLLQCQQFQLPERTHQDWIEYWTKYLRKPPSISHHSRTNQ